MTDKQQQLDRLQEAVRRRMAESDAASRAGRASASGPPPEEPGGSQRSLTETGRPQDTFSVRDKSSQKGKKTADKWNQ